MIRCVIATKGETEDETSEAIQTENINGNFFSKIPPQTEGGFFNPKSVRKGAFFIPKKKGKKMTTRKYTHQEETEARENWQLRKRKALQRELEKRQEKIFRRNPDRNLLALFQEYLQNERAA